MCKLELPCKKCGAGTSCEHTHPQEGRLPACECKPVKKTIARKEASNG